MQLSRFFVACGACALIGTGLVVSSRAQQPPPRPAGGTGRAEPTQAQNFPDYPKQDLADGYKVVEGWPQKPPDAVWGAMASVTVDPSGNIWTFNRGNIPVQVYRPDGTLVKTWGTGGIFKNPHQIRFDKDGNLWAADNGYHTVRKFTADGQLLLTIGIKDQSGEDQTHLNQPTDMAITPTGEVFISDGYVNSRVVHYDRNGKFVKAWGKLGTGPGEFSLPHGIALDSHGRLYVVDRNNARIQVFDQAGKYLTEWRNIITPWAIWITPNDDIYVCGSSPSRWRETPQTGVQMNGVPAKDQMIAKFAPDGRVKAIWMFPVGVSKPGELDWVHGIAVDAHGDLYLGDIRGRRAQKFAFEPAVRPVRSTSSR
jgi:streptogramin lyase